MEKVKANDTVKVGEAAAREATVQNIKRQIKPLSENAFLAFFQGIWRGWLAWWYGFSDRHPKASKIIYMIVFFIVFSEGVTLWQFIVMTFMPYWFGALNDVSFVWPAVSIPGLFDPAGNQLSYAIFNEPAVAGKLGGLGNFLAFEIAVFTAQCINFPLQRNITFRSHGNPWWQAMWYFIGWVAISVLVNALWGIMNPFMIAWEWNFVLVGLIKTVVTGGLSMVVFFPIFLIIFPDYNAVKKRAQKQLEKLKAAGADKEKITQAEAKLADASYKALLSNTEKEEAKTTTQASAKAMSYFAVIKNAEKAKAKADTLTNEQEKTKAAQDVKVKEGKIETAFEAAVKAIEVKEEAKKARLEALKTSKATA